MSIYDDVVAEFLSGNGVDHRNRNLDLILSQNDEWLNKSHDYIQWCFPSTEQSLAVPGSPYVSTGFIRQVKDPNGVRAGVLRSFLRILKCYGLDYQPENNAVLKATDFDKKLWVTKRSHHFRRITRISKALQIVELSDLSSTLISGLLRFSEITNAAGPRTIEIWEKTMR